MFEGELSTFGFGDCCLDSLHCSEVVSILQCSLAGRKQVGSRRNQPGVRFGILIHVRNQIRWNRRNIAFCGEDVELFSLDVVGVSGSQRTLRAEIPRSRSVCR